MDWARLEPLLREVDAKDATTAAHTARVALYTQVMAEEEGLDDDTVQRYMQAALLHDIGKVDIPGEILGKPGALDAPELAIMRTHPMKGFERLVSMGVEDPIVLELVRWHHERLDGTGYPDRLVASRIPLGAQWFAVIDSFDAMTSSRPYRPRSGPAMADDALLELERHAGTWYAPGAVRRFVDLHRSGRLDWILHHLNEGAQAESIPAAATPAEVLSLRKTLRG